MLKFIYMRNNPVIWIIILLCLSGGLAAQEGSYVPKYLLSYPESVVYALKQPTQWGTEGWLKTAGVLGVGVGLYFVEQELQEWVQSNRYQALDDAGGVVEHFGNFRLLVPAAALTALGGYVFEDDHTVDTGMLSLKSMLLSGAASFTLQVITQRERPEAGLGHGFNTGKGFSWKRDSFPSGHSTMVWSVAPILAKQYEQQSWVAPTVYTLATLTSLSRVYENKHWATDVFAGAVIGYLGAQVTLNSTPRFGFGVSENEGLCFVWRF
ncbi:MAG: phosphatase PAP2 family protein [Candidatus Cloacimonadaceae bacterium]|jgi:hypothetical protein